MWHIWRNDNNVCKGKYYYSTSAKSYYWYTYDQVIFRPEWIDNFNIDNLKIISKVNDNSLLTKSNIPNKREILEHLPLKFRIDMEE